MRVNPFARLENGRGYFQDGGMRLYRWAPKSGPPVAIPDWKYQLRGGYENRLAVEDWIGGTGRSRPPAGMDRVAPGSLQSCRRGPGHGTQMRRREGGGQCSYLDALRKAITSLISPPLN